jgi:gliding motility-associated-like protein
MRVIVLLTAVCGNAILWAQPVYNNCIQSLELCSGEIYSVNNIGANKTFCPGCEDDFAFCFLPNNTIWLRFTTNDFGGNVTVNISNLNFEISPGQGTELQASLLSASVPCNAASYTQIGNCVNNASANFALTAGGLAPNSTYYIVVSGSNTGVGITSAAECTFDVSISGTAVDRANPTAQISLSSQAICANQILTATAVLSDCPESSDYRWYINGNLVGVTTEPTFLTTSALHGDIISVENNCFTLCPIFVSAAANPLSVTTPLADAGTDVYMAYGDTVQLNAAVTSGSFEWSPGFGISNPFVLDPFVWPVTTTVFTLTVTDGDCIVSDQVTVFVEPQLQIPNTFSPNNDGLNDTWEILGIELYPNCFVKIYDRWGQEVFQSSGYSKQKAWDGTGKGGGQLSEGVYFFMLELRDEEKQKFNGSITLIR